LAANNKQTIAGNFEDGSAEIAYGTINAIIMS